MTERNDRGIVIGGGPFQPPSKSELDLLRSERDDLVREVQALKLRGEQQEQLITRRGRLLDVTTDGDLQNLLSHVLGNVVDEIEISVTNGMGDESIEITIEGAHIDGDDIVPNAREFEVSVDIGFEHRATLWAADRDEAHDKYAEALRDALHSVEVTIDGVEEQESFEAEFGFITVSEL